MLHTDILERTGALGASALVLSLLATVPSACTTADEPVGVGVGAADVSRETRTLASFSTLVNGKYLCAEG